MCAPCAGPILAAVTSVSASSGATTKVVAVALAYAAGLSAVMLLYGLGGRAVLDRVKRHTHGHAVERTLGAVLLITGVVMLTNLDVRFEEALAKDTSLPAFLVDPTRSLENSNAVQNRLASLRPASRFAATTKGGVAHPDAKAGAAGRVAIPGVKTPSLPKLGQPRSSPTTSAGSTPPATSRSPSHGLKGHVVLVDFWTYTCINCIRTLPFLKGLYAHYHRYGLEIVGVETPEFTFEQEASNVQQAINSDGLRYPVVQDNRYGTWNAYQNQYWPAEYLIDATGQVRHTQFGEGDYKQDEAAVRELLYDAGAHNLPAADDGHGDHAVEATSAPPRPTSTRSARRDSPSSCKAAPTSMPGVNAPILNEFGLHGTWTATSESVTPAKAGAWITGRFQAAHVYLVMTSTDNRPRTARVLVNGKPIPASEAGSDVHNGLVTVQGQRLYSLISLPGDQQQTFTIQIPPGISAYDFTFG